MTPSKSIQSRVFYLLEVAKTGDILDQQMTNIKNSPVVYHTEALQTSCYSSLRQVGEVRWSAVFFCDIRRG